MIIARIRFDLTEHNNIEIVVDSSEIPTPHAARPHELPAAVARQEIVKAINSDNLTTLVQQRLLRIARALETPPDRKCQSPTRDTDT